MLSGIPHVLRMIFSYFYSSFSDWLLRTERMSLNNVRKLANFVMAGGGALLTLGLSFSGCEPILAIFFMMTGTAINGLKPFKLLMGRFDLILFSIRQVFFLIINRCRISWNISNISGLESKFCISIIWFLWINIICSWFHITSYRWNSHKSSGSSQLFSLNKLN